MPEITNNIRHLVNDPDWDCSQKNEAWGFLLESIVEHEEGQLPVDAEWLEALEFKKLSDSSNEKLWRYSPSALSTVVVDVSWIFTGEEEQWTVFVNNHYFADSPTRQGVIGLLKVAGGGR